MPNADPSITTMQELLNNLIRSGNKLKEKIIGEKEIYIFSQPISKNKYEKLCAFEEKAFNIEKNENSLQISSPSSKITIFVPYFTDGSDRIIYFVKNIKIHAILPVFTIISIFALGLSYLKLSAAFSHLGILNLLPTFLSSTSKSLLIFGAIMPYLMSLIVLGVMCFINFMNLKLYHLIQPTKFKNFFCSFYLPFFLIGVILPLMTTWVYLSKISPENPLCQILMIIIPIFTIILFTILNFLRIKDKKVNKIISLNYSLFSISAFYLLMLLSYNAASKIMESNQNFWIIFGISLLIIFFMPLSALMFTLLSRYSHSSPTSVKEEMLTRLSIFSALAILILTMVVVFQSMTIFKVTGIGEHYETIYVNKDLSQYKNIINNLNYDKKTNEIKSWVILQTPSLIVISKSKDNQPLYVFRRFPYELISIIPPKHSKNIEKN